MRLPVSFCVFARSLLATAAPFIVSDPVVVGVSQCGAYIDSEPKVTSPVIGTAGEVGAAPRQVTSGAIGVRELGGPKGPATVADDKVGSLLLEASLNVARGLSGRGNGGRE